MFFKLLVVSSVSRLWLQEGGNAYGGYLCSKEDKHRVEERALMCKQSGGLQLLSILIGMCGRGRVKF